ncbi:cache domain-containing protein [Marinomonas balearica]|uniref:Methyl-accepting chemotaxis protein n=1 Tax=Marinomonas balearica TaxID=491947 RepID=A0A4R6M459_9GAMM|nr:cache domain-containing protein [Marinomonas balearica]TDO95806.1 methyl-accepting chemotaxis protein [Marinomonas balearica]
MKLSRQINLITVVLGVGAIAFCTLMFQSSKHNLIEARKHEATELLRFATQLAEHEIERFEKGELSRQEAENNIASTLSKFHKGASFIWANDGNAIARVHTRKDVIGTFQSSYAKYISILKANQFHFILGESRKPGSNDLYVKLNTMTLIPKWDWMIGYGLYMDELNDQAWRLSAPYFVSSIFTFLLILGIVWVLLKKVKRSVGAEPIDLKHYIQAMERGDLSHTVSNPEKDSALSALMLLNKSLSGIFLDFLVKTKKLNSDINQSEKCLERLSKNINLNQQHHNNIQNHLAEYSTIENEYADMVSTLTPATVELHENSKTCFMLSEHNESALNDLRTLNHDNKQRSDFLIRLATKLSETVETLKSSSSSSENSSEQLGLIHHLEHLIQEEISELKVLSGSFITEEEHLDAALNSKLTAKITEVYKSSTNIMELCHDFYAFKASLKKNQEARYQLVEQLERDLTDLAKENENLVCVVKGMSSVTQKLENDINTYKL